MALSTLDEYPVFVMVANSVKNCTSEGLVLAR
jgi:hypothetical protein